MKKISLLLLAATVVVLASCGGGAADKAKAEADSLAAAAAADSVMKAAEAAAAAHRGRSARRGARGVDRLEGSALAHALFRDRASARRRPYHAHPHRTRVACPECPAGAALGLAQGRSGPL